MKVVLTRECFQWYANNIYFIFIDLLTKKKNQCPFYTKWVNVCIVHFSDRKCHQKPRIRGIAETTRVKGSRLKQSRLERPAAATDNNQAWQNLQRNDFNDKTELAIREVVKPSIKILTISRWTDAFQEYVSSYALAHLYSFQGLLKYLYDIRLGPSRCMEGDLG